MAAFGSPSARSVRTSRSRAVSSGNGFSGTAARGAARNPRTRRATPGPKMASPAATARIARAMSSCSARFRR